MYPAHPSRTRQAFAVLQLSLQLAVLTLVPLVDGALDIIALTRVAHVESKGRSDGTPVHNHITCQLCQVAGPKLASAQGPSLPKGAGIGAAPPIARAHPFRAGPRAASAHARAPPLA